MTEKRIGAVLGAIALAAGSACAAQQQMGPGAPQPRDVGTPIVLVPSGDTCSISYKQETITSYPDKFVIFNVSNYCGAEQVVMVGNFRKTESPSQSLADCKLAMDPAETERIFVNDSEAQRTATTPGQNNQGEPGARNIRLRIKPNAQLPSAGTLEYHFDVCLNGPVSKDPRLVIER